MGLRHPTARAWRRASAALVCALALAPGTAAASDAPGVDLAQVDRDLREIESLLAAAYFRTALGLVNATRDQLAAASEREKRASKAGVQARTARLEVLAATAELAIGAPQRARASMRRALGADPDLTLDAGRTSPRVVALLDEARAELPAAPGAP